MKKLTLLTAALFTGSVLSSNVSSIADLLRREDLPEETRVALADRLMNSFDASSLETDAEKCDTTIDVADRFKAWNSAGDKKAKEDACVELANEFKGTYKKSNLQLVLVPQSSSNLLKRSAKWFSDHAGSVAKLSAFLSVVAACQIHAELKAV